MDKDRGGSNGPLVMHLESYLVQKSEYLSRNLIETSLDLLYSLRGNGERETHTPASIYFSAIWQIDGETMNIVKDFILGGSKSLQMVTAAMKLKKKPCSWGEKL